MEKDQLDLDGIVERILNRRDFIRFFGQGLGAGALATLVPGCGGGSSGGSSSETQQNSKLPRPSREFTALKRTSFGPRRDELASMRKLGIHKFLERQLDHLSLDDSALEAEIAARFPLSLQPAPVLIQNFPDNARDVVTHMISATLYRQVFSQRQLYEVMVEFWSDHFNIQLTNGLCPTLKPVDDRQVIRAHALGNFGDLLHASAKSPAMLFYLDNFFNRALAPNENYARELMELHTLGVEGGYSEADVKEVARCFTGWTLRFPGDAGGAFGEFIFFDGIHDNQAKQVLGVAIAAGGGISDGERVIDILAAHPSTATFIATKLCRRFISDNPSAATVAEVAQAFSNSNGDIKTTLRALFASAAFADEADRKFTRPAEFLGGLIRAVAPDTPYPADNGEFWYTARNVLGQLPFHWPTPDGYPDHRDYWASTGGFLNRWRLAFLSFSGITPGNVLQIDYPKMLNGADTMAAVVDSVTDAVLMRPLAENDRAIIMRWFEQELDVLENSPLPGGLAELIAGLTAALLLSSAYFQLR